MVQTEDAKERFSRRLRHAMARAGWPDRGSQARLAKLTGTTAKAANKWVNGDAVPNRNNLAVIARAVNVDPRWLEYGVGDLMDGATPSRNDVVGVPYYMEVRASAGFGCVPLNEARVTLMEVAESFLKNAGVPVTKAVLLEARGDSMAGDVNHGDLLLVDLSTTTMHEGQIFVVSVDGELLVKKVQRIPGGIKLISSNPAYDSITIRDEGQGYDVRIVGRVAGSWAAKTFL